ncbi:MAG: transglutaminase domain-containing protein [Sandaracinus sp.]|nr:transglutaminase domain-containing protein [Sandaracinus sp.]
MRRLDVRARLEVPVMERDGTRRWAKPRFAWSPADDVAAQASLFSSDLPPAIAWTDLDGPSRRVLAACGAKDDLDERAVVACLDAIASTNHAARRALARYVLDRVRVEPARIERLGLRGRAWVSALDGTLHVPSELIFPEPLAHALLGDDGRFPDPAVAAALDAPTADRLGLQRATSLSLAQVATAHENREAPRALLEWLEAGLEARRFTAAEVRERFATLRLRDDEGTLRTPAALLRRGGRALFGARRGDWSASSELPRVARALGIPNAPDDAAIVAFLAEVGAELSRGVPPDHDTLVRVLPECLARLRDADVALLEGIAVVARSGSTLRLVRVDDPSLRLGSPPALADALPRDAVLELLPLDREPSLDTRLLAAGVPDLWSELEIARVMSGARRNDPRTEALARRVGAEVALHDTLEVEGSFFGASVRVPTPAAFDGKVLRVVVDVLDDPALAAPALAPEPHARAAAVARLTTDVPANAPAPRRSEAPPRPKLFDRVRRFFGGEPVREAKESREAKGAEPSARDARLFAPRDTLGSQLDRTDGWLDARREVPRVGFAFAPTRLPAPWVYAPQLVVTRFDRRGQRWEPSDVPRPDARGDVGTLAMRGRLPAGESVLPIPIYGELVELRASEGDVAAWRGARAARSSCGSSERPSFVCARASRCGAVVRRGARRFGDGRARSRSCRRRAAEEVLDFVASFDDEDSPFERALAVRDFVRRRYRYDPSYLEDPAVGRYLARVTRGRAQAHVAALHVGADAKHLGAGVCYELNALACELLRRVGIPAGLASGWVLDGGSASEPDHLWALAFLVDARGRAAWVPIDASSTEDGRPLQVPRRPPVPFRAPADPGARAPRPTTPRLELGRDGPSRGAERGRGAARGARGAEPGRTKKSREPRLPRAELFKVLHHLGKSAASRSTTRRAPPSRRASAARSEGGRGCCSRVCASALTSRASTARGTSVARSRGSRVTWRAPSSNESSRVDDAAGDFGGAQY